MSETRPNVLLVIPAGKEAQQATRAALDLAKARGGTLVALVVLDPAVSTRAASALSDVGFMGEELSEQVEATLRDEYRAGAEALLRALVEQAKRDLTRITPLIEQGDASEICGRVIDAHAVGVAVLVAEKHSWLTRFLAHDAAVQLPALSGCEVRVMEED